MRGTRRRALEVGGAFLAAFAVSTRSRGADTLDIVMDGRPNGSHVWFNPLGIHIAPDQTIRWINRDPSNSHTATAYHPDLFDRPLRIPEGAEPWDSGYLLPEEFFSVTLTVPGVYDYYCLPHEHAGMVGRIVVGEGFRDSETEPYAAEGAGLPEAALEAFPSVEEILTAGVVEHQPWTEPSERISGGRTRCQSSNQASPADPASDDAELVVLARQGSEQAVRLLVQRCNQQLFRTARGVVRDDAEAEDVVQEAYVRAFTNLDSFRGEARFSTWVTRIALNVAYGRLRWHRPMVGLSRVEAEGGADGAQIAFPTTPIAADPEKELGREQVRLVLEQAVDRIPEPFRIVFMLRDIQGMNMEETAALLSVNPKTVKTRLFRARRLMRLELEKALSPQFAEIFPFDGERCVQMAERIIARLRNERV